MSGAVTYVTNPSIPPGQAAAARVFVSGSGFASTRVYWVGRLEDVAGALRNPAVTHVCVNPADFQKVAEADPAANENGTELARA